MKFKILFISILLTVALSASSKDNMLKRAWAEYHFQNFSMSEKLFKKILNLKISTKEEKIQSRLALAMIVQMRMPGGEPEEALPMYEKLLTDIGSSHKATPFIMNLMAQCYMFKEKPSYKAARNILGKIRKQFPKSYFARTAGLKLVEIILLKTDAGSMKKAISFLEDELKNYPGNKLEETMHYMIGNIAILLKEKKYFIIARKHLIKMYDNGIVAKGKKLPDTLMQIAIISEKELGDIPTAIKYYRLLEKKVSADMRADYSKKHADKLEKSLK